jgi:hypothetical protein
MVSVGGSLRSGRMKRMRLLLPAALLLFLPLLGVGPAMAPAMAKDGVPSNLKDVKPPKRPANLEELGQRLNELAKRIDRLLAEAGKDADERKIDEYVGYSSSRLKKTRGRVRAKDLVVFMVDPSKGYALRQKAQKAIRMGGATRNDPDLSTEGSRTKRAQFSKTQLVKHLKHENRMSRGLVKDLLILFWSPNRVRNPEIMAYAVDKEDTWKPASKAWDQYLKKK